MVSECGSMQVSESQADAMKLVKQSAEKHVQENQRELSRGVLAPTVKVSASCQAHACIISSCCIAALLACTSTAL